MTPTTPHQQQEERKAQLHQALKVVDGAQVSNTGLALVFAVILGLLAPISVPAMLSEPFNIAVWILVYHAVMVFGLCYALGQWWRYRNKTKRYKALIEQMPQEDFSFQLDFEVTAIAAKHERSTLHQRTLLFIPLLLVGVLAIVGGVVTIVALLSNIGREHVLTIVVVTILTIGWIFFWGNSIYKYAKHYNRQRHLTRQTVNAAQHLRAQKQANSGAISVAQEHTSTGAMSLMQSQHGGMTVLGAHEDDNEQVTFDFDENDQTQTTSARQHITSSKR